MNDRSVSASGLDSSRSTNRVRRIVDDDSEEESAASSTFALISKSGVNVGRLAPEWLVDDNDLHSRRWPSSC